MAINPQYKVNKIAKDLGMKSKELSDILASGGLEVKTQRTLEPVEFDFLLETLTRANQISNIEDYLDGVTKIPSKLPPAQPKEEAPAAPVETAKAEEKPREEKPRAEEIKAEPPAKTEAPKKAEAPKAAPKAEAPKAEPSARPAQPRPQTQGDRPAYNGTPRTDRPQGSNTFGQRPAQSQPGQSRPQGNSPYGQRPAQAPFGQGRPQGGNRPDKGGKSGKGGPSFGGGFDKDREHQQVGGLKETFRPQATIRITNNDAPSQRGATRVVDTRGGASYDPSKYDEKLETFVSDRDRALRGGDGGKARRQQPGAARGTSSKNSFKNKKKSSEAVHILPTNVTLPEEIIVSDLASALKVKTGEVVKALMMMGIMATVNQVVDYDTASLVAESLGISVSKQVVVSIEERLFDEAEDTEDTLKPRAPVVCVMGHVDHGKTSLLDAIRHTQVTAGEAGGITQHIGAYRVKVKGQDITFLDTPGHEAFTAMRARGAQATDIAILVVAADDGIMPQTIEAIHHAKAAGIDIIVAINKMDKPTADPENIKQELTKYDLVPEEWGGDVMCVPVSALTGQGLDDLLESVLLVAEVKELKANPDRRAKGIIIEAKLDKGRGPVATVLVQNGTLHDGDIVIAGTAVGRVRAMTDHRGKTLKVAGPSVPVEITGLAEVPVAGDEFQAVEDERMARTLADDRKSKAKEEGFRANARANLNDLFAQISDGV